MKRKTRNVGKLLIKLGYAVIAWITVSFFGVMLVGFIPGSAQNWVNSLFFSMISGMIMAPAYLVMFALEDTWPDRKDETGVKTFKRTSGMKKPASTFEERGKIWNS